MLQAADLGCIDPEDPDDLRIPLAPADEHAIPILHGDGGRCDADPLRVLAGLGLRGGTFALRPGGRRLGHEGWAQGKPHGDRS